METVTETVSAYAGQDMASDRQGIALLSQPTSHTALHRVLSWYHGQIIPDDVRIYNPGSVKGGEERSEEKKLN
jgi:hypothetical protein